ncbi:MAG: ADP-ribose pyrophosphatase [Peptococcaceae bacterium BICA1-7]|nr:MAG: ADP-ribose pyrophosphatase [Peptococcaceae bacterium BICA1-7]HBV97658.1 NUDIX hydrolase [Desulfotomaculum sp.]
MDFNEKKVSSETVYSGKILNLRVDRVELPNGNMTAREVVEHAGAVAVVAQKEGRLLMVRQFRYPVGKVLLEIPAGKIEKGEDPLLCAARELIEETGYEAGEMKLLLSFFSTPGFSDEVLHVYLAGDLKYRGQKPDEDEFIQVEELPLERAVEMIGSGEICDAKSIIGILAVKSELVSLK